MLQKAVDASEPPLSLAKGQNVFMAKGEDAGAVEVGQTVVHLVVVLISRVAELAVIKGFGPGVGDKEGVVVGEALRGLGLERVVVIAGAVALVGDALRESE